ncbi:MAG: penicillin-binding protein 2 [Planctomycetes bacterium]|nr:penicillin-binding protein 2 [Planctomycetota bacterium]
MSEYSLPASQDEATPLKATPQAFLCLALLLGFFGIIAGRLVFLQVIDAGDSTAIAEKHMASSFSLPEHRGAILDRRGRDLAVSVRHYGCAIDPEAVEDIDVTLSALDGALLLKPEEKTAFFDYLTRRRLQDKTVRFAWVRRDLTEVEVKSIQEMNLQGVILSPGWERTYPQGELACHVIGFTSRDGQGLEGAELISDEYLQSKSGKIAISRDARRCPFILDDEIILENQKGMNVQLTIDATIQEFVEDELRIVMAKYKAESATALVMDPYTGEVLALANTPGYNLNLAKEAEQSLRFNNAISAIYEPGSVFKPFVLAAAIDAGVITPETKIDCENGEWNLGFRVLHDVHPYGWLTAAEVVIKSSNTGIAKIGGKLGSKGLYNSLASYGFGEKTGIELTGELPGLLRPLERWNPKFSITSIPMGQEIGVTSLQLLTSFSSLINGGVLLQPKLVSNLQDHEGEVLYQTESLPVRRVISEETSVVMREILGRVVTEGTGRNANCEEYSIGGKTGTAQIAGQGGYLEGQYMATFCGFAPVEAPRLAVLVSVKKPRGEYYGGLVSAPSVKRILRDALLYLKVPTRNHAENLALRR